MKVILPFEEEGVINRLRRTAENEVDVFQGNNAIEEENNVVQSENDVAQSEGDVVEEVMGKIIDNNESFITTLILDQEYKKLGIKKSFRQIQRDIEELVKRSLIVEDGKHGRYKKYKIIRR